MKIEIVILFSVICVSSAVEFNSTTTAIPMPVVKSDLPGVLTIHYNATATQEECSLSVLKFPGAYLRGAKAGNLITYNNISNLKACQKLCCYERSFQCLSLSYLRPLRQCFLMNLTRHDEGVNLIKVPNMVHVQTLTEFDFMTTTAPAQETTEMFVDSTQATTMGGKDYDTTISQGVATTTESSDTTGDQTEEYFTEPIESASESGVNGDADGVSTTPQASGANQPSSQSTTAPEGGNPTGVLRGPASPEKLIAEGCSENCSNNGVCMQKTFDVSREIEFFCECNKGFDGKYCETEVVKEGGLAVWIIVVIVIAVLILILIIVACVLMRFYKKKGEYRVVDYFRRWTRRQKKPKKPDNPNEIAHMEDSDEAFPPNGKSLGLHEDSTRTAV